MCFFFFNDTATTEIYTLSLHDALPILEVAAVAVGMNPRVGMCDRVQRVSDGTERLVLHDDQVQRGGRSEEHTSELQSQSNLVCRLLLEKKKKETQRKGERIPH